MIAGLFRDQEYLTETVAVSCGDVLVFYTDGVTEARKHKVMFGQERLSRVIADNAHRTAPEIAGEIYASVTDWGAGSRLDDIALLVLKGQ
jgi:sigma-B regulation protein RsbU (phosphoserine phosphatase)